VLSLPPSVRVFVATQPVDGRKGVDSLAAMVGSVFSHDPLSGHLYVFFSKRCDRVRVMYPTGCGSIEVFESLAKVRDGRCCLAETM
jgi:transposase